ncbi:hypothetical protein KIL84_009426 [Mauremys mutica]|uniref:Uncharacterized protein n=1 Tax=Mauremys mutica TaxID=74926 RepID=A0A9D3XK97_9SAUR|nr:hypothetical protein KIL84_009426 [Mauremys mutica]
MPGNAIRACPRERGAFPRGGAARRRTPSPRVPRGRTPSPRVHCRHYNFRVQAAPALGVARGGRRHATALPAVQRVLPPHLHLRPHHRAGGPRLRARLRPGRGRVLRAPEPRETVETHQAQV